MANRKGLILMLAGLALMVVAVAIVMKSPGGSRITTNKAPVADAHQSSSADTHNRQNRVPAHLTAAPAVKDLGPTLPPERFHGKVREAYQVAKAIPQTLAQLPCYCYCDEGHGHKSLHTCYESDHSSMCAVCVNEALLAYRLQTEEKLTPAQIRERIIAEFAPKP